MTLKEKIQQQCLHTVAGKLEGLQQKLADLQESMANETKSSAGDKYETSRAMLHIEQDQIGRQVAELQAQQAVLHTIGPAASSVRAALGSLLRIADVYYYLSTGLGKMQVDGKAVIALSLQSPLGAKLKGLTVGDEAVMNNKALIIQELL